MHYPIQTDQCGRRSAPRRKALGEGQLLHDFNVDVTTDSRSEPNPLAVKRIGLYARTRRALPEGSQRVPAAAGASRVGRRSAQLFATGTRTTSRTSMCSAS